MIGELMGVEVCNRRRRSAPEAHRKRSRAALRSRWQGTRMLGWTPRFAGVDGLRRGLVHTATWFRDPANLRLYKPQLYTV